MKLKQQASMNKHLESINTLVEFERCGVEYEYATENEIKVCCPFHDDKSPSCSVNIKKNLFKCHTAGCGKSGDLVTLLAKQLDTTRQVIWYDLSKRYDFETVKAIDSSTIETYHEKIWAAKPLLKELYDRGVTDKLIRKYRLGLDDGRISIPIKNVNDVIVNVRRYLPGAPGPKKMRNKKGHGKNRLFPIDQLKYETIVICGGEIKAIVAADKLNKHGLGAITATAGEGNWEVEFNKLLKDKKLYVCLDIDVKGVQAANMLCARLKKDASWIGNVSLPLDLDKYPSGDINDYFGPEKKTAKDFLNLIAKTEEWELLSQTAIDDTSEAIELHLNEASLAVHTSKRIKIKANVTAMDTAPYVIPKKLKIACSRDQKLCGICPVFAETPDEIGIVKLNIHPESDAILSMVATSKESQRLSIMSGLGIPDCKVVDFTPEEFYNVEDIRLSPQLEISSRSVDDIMQPALSIGHGLETNENYEFIGRMYPHPKNQQSVILISKSKTTSDALSNYKPSNEDLEKLEIFQPESWDANEIDKKLTDIYSDFSANVTRIFERSDLHFIIDLTYHSVLLFEFDQMLTKGWVETLITGDSSQGKSETILRLMEHYKLGERIECKNATVAGLLGGLQQLNSGRWFVTWGVIPTHDKRLVILEEIKGASIEVLGKLTDMRSSGIAEIPKIEKRRTHARTRLIMVSNPRSDMQLASYNFGVEAVKELIGGLEDIRRFDAALLTSAEQISGDILNKLQRYRPRVEHTYTSDLCNSLILWAWTRAQKQVLFLPEATDLILSESTRLCSVFTEKIPLVDRGSMRFKICRLAIALACRTFSNDELQNVLVRDCHVQYITNFLERIYSDSIFGYKDYSDAISLNNRLLNPDILKSRILQSPFPYDFVQQMLYTNEMDFRDISDWLGWDKAPTAQLLSLFVRKNALQRAGHGYRKTPKFISFLKELLVSKEMQDNKRPDFINENNEEF